MTRPSNRTAAARTGLFLAAATVLWAGAALADPCEAPVAGFKPGRSFAGQVRYVGDGDSLCIGAAADPSSWIEVRLADFYAPELGERGGRAARAAMVRVAEGRYAQCSAVKGDHGRTVSYDRVIAVCRIGGVSLAELMRGVGVAEGGRGAGRISP